MTGGSDRAHIGGFHVERSGAFSQTVENHVHAPSVDFVHGNFVRIHWALHVARRNRGTVISKLCSRADIVRMADARVAAPTAA